VKHDLNWIERAHKEGWDVLLDAAAFVPTNMLDLSLVNPDFVSISFYKIFGYPTGLGCLLVRKDSFAKLIRPDCAGGTVSLTAVGVGRHFLLPGHERFESGTINYLSIPAVEIGLDYINTIGMNDIGARVTMLTGLLLDELTALHHHAGKALVRIFGPCTTTNRGGTIAMNFYNEGGKSILFKTSSERRIV
jgi:selenocysteine lyase/cysteine desulfurase